jgi:hypothetical protein
VVAVDCLAEEGDFGRATLGEGGDLANYILQAAAPLGPARVWDDAESAAVIAASLYRNEGRRTLFAHGRDVFVVLPGAELGIGAALARTRHPDQVGEVAVGVRAHHQVHPRHPLEQRGAEALGHAADHAQDVARALVALQLAHSADHPLLGVVAHGTGVHQHDVGVGRIVGARVARAVEESEHQLRVRDVHLAAVGFDVDPFHAAPSGGPAL